MKTLLKRLLANAGFCLQRMPASIPTGHFLSRDLRLVVGDNPNPICIDAGAHRGDFTTELLACLDRPVVHAFEPVPAMFQVLQQRHGASSGVHLVQAGLSDIDGSTEMHLFTNPALNSFLPMTNTGHHFLGRPDQAGTITAPLKQLQTHAREHAISQIDLLKIDTQGYEMHVLRGAEALFAENRIRCVLVELNFATFYSGQVSAHEVIGHLHARGLQLVEFYEKCRHPPHLSWCTALFTLRSATT